MPHVDISIAACKVDVISDYNRIYNPILYYLRSFKYDLETLYISMLRLTN